MVTVTGSGTDYLVPPPQGLSSLAATQGLASLSSQRCKCYHWCPARTETTGTGLVGVGVRGRIAAFIDDTGDDACLVGMGTRDDLPVY